MAGLIFVVTVAAIVIVSSAGMRVLDLPVLPSQIAPVRIVAGFPFAYVSAARTKAERDQRLVGLPPIYRLETAPLDRFEGAARDLLAKLAAFEAAHPDPTALFFNRRKALGALADEFNARGPYETNADDLAALLTAGDAPARAALFENGFAALRQIYSEGVHDAAGSRRRTRRRRDVRGRAVLRRLGGATGAVHGGRPDLPQGEPRLRGRARARRSRALQALPQRRPAKPRVRPAPRPHAARPT